LEIWNTVPNLQKKRQKKDNTLQRNLATEYNVLRAIHIYIEKTCNLLSEHNWSVLVYLKKKFPTDHIHTHRKLTQKAMNVM